MNENILRDLLAKIYDEEILYFDNLPQFQVSLRHRIAMKRIFNLFEKNSHNIANNPQPISHSKHTHVSLSKRLIIIFVLIICATLMAGFIFCYISNNFHGTIYTDYTELFAINAENCPETIEYEYCLTDLPNMFELTERNFSLYLGVYTLYRNDISGKEIAFSQYPKKAFGGQFNTEKHKFEDIEINGHGGLYIEFSNSSIIFWDNGDYVLEIDSNLPKDELIFLAESAKVLEK